MRLGFGASGAWGMAWFSARKAERLIGAALDAGIAHFDTAGFYAGGEAESRLGRFLRSRPDVFISTKTGTRYVGRGRAVKDFSDAAIRADVEASRRRLDRDSLDLLYLHGPDAASIDLALPTLEALIEEGKVSSWGVCGEGAALTHAIDVRAGALMGVYNVLDAHHRGVFERAKAAGIGVAAISPLAQGLYRRRIFTPTSIADGWKLARALVKNRQSLAAAQKVRPLLAGVEGLSPAQVALCYALAGGFVDIAMTTTTRERHLLESIGAVSRTLPQPVLAALDAASRGA